MSNSLRDAYALRALAQIPRLLGNMDRNPFSPTYGCCHRDFWLDKTSDFPDAVRQFSVHAFALVYTHEMPDNPYYRHPKIRDWTIAAMDYWARIQHQDGSFDEFYPNERGWVGPTAFTTFTTVEAFRLLEDEVPADVAARVKAAIHKAATFIAAGESEEDHLANHHAMACTAVWKAYALTGDENLRAGFDRVWQGFLGYHNSAEGWSREYDGIDPGYLSATVSFLGKVYQENPDPEILRVCRESIEMCSYFAYPNGFYAGSMGSRNTLHFYCHGFEVFAKEVPMAAAVGEAMLKGLSEGKLVPPEIMADRYAVYRTPELLQSWVDYAERPAELPKLPYQQDTLYKWFPGCRVWVHSDADRYVIANLAKGGVVKVFDKASGKLVANDCGLLGQLDDGKVVSTQWVDPNYTVEANETGFTVSGNMNRIPSNKYFTLTKGIIFRLVLLVTGIHPSLAHSLKGLIRRILMLGNRPVPIRFKRHLRLAADGIHLSDEVDKDAGVTLRQMQVGDEFFLRYVPQSRYFQSQEMDVHGAQLSTADLATLNAQGHWHSERSLDPKIA